MVRPEPSIVGAWGRRLRQFGHNNNSFHQVYYCNLMISKWKNICLALINFLLFSLKDTTVLWLIFAQKMALKTENAKFLTAFKY